LPPEEADRLVAALRTHRDRAMVLAMLLAGLRRCEVLGLRFEDVQALLKSPVSNAIWSPSRPTQSGRLRSSHQRGWAAQ
jgi:hypothetical protein